MTTRPPGLADQGATSSSPAWDCILARDAQARLACYTLIGPGYMVLAAKWPSCPVMLAVAMTSAQAMALVDNLAVIMHESFTKLEAAGGDQAKVKVIGEKFKVRAESDTAEGKALCEALTPDEKKVVENYARKKLAPLMSKFMSVMIKKRPAPAAGASAADTAAP